MWPVAPMTMIRMVDWAEAGASDCRGEIYAHRCPGRGSSAQARSRLNLEAMQWCYLVPEGELD